VSLVAELKRRNVFRVAAAYAVLSWLVLQVADVLLDALELPVAYSKFIVVLLVLGFIPALVFSWVYELTPEGLKRESEVDRDESVTNRTAHKLNAAIVVLLAVAVGIFAIDRLVMNRPAAPATPVAESAPPAREERAALPVEGVPEVAEPPPKAQPAEASVAVLPFTTRSRNEDDQFFSDGVHDDLLTQLAKIGSLRVISRTSVMDYRETTKRIPEIADELGVATIVEGAVQRSGNMVRITAQLIDADTDEHLWAESYDRELTAENLFAIQTEIATSIAGALKTTLSPEEEAALRRRLTDDLEALEAYQRAKWLLDTFSVEAFRTAEQELAYAVERDPEFAGAWAMLARAHLAHYWFGTSTAERRQKAWEAILTGRAIEPDLPELDIAEGYYHYWGFKNYDEALAVLEPALAAYPNDAELHKLVAFVHRRAGRFEKTIDHMRRAQELDPRSPAVLQTLGETYYRLGDYTRAEQYADRMDRIMPADTLRYTVRAGIVMGRDGNPAEAARLFGLAPDISFAQELQWTYYLYARDFEQALEVADIVTADNKGLITPAVGKGIALYFAGNREAAKRELENALEELSVLRGQLAQPAHLLLPECQVEAALGHVDRVRDLCGRAMEEMPFDAFDGPTYRHNVARGYALAGLVDLAFEALAEASESRAAPCRNELLLDPFLESLHDDPRWERLIAEARP